MKKLLPIIAILSLSILAACSKNGNDRAVPTPASGNSSQATRHGGWQSIARLSFSGYSSSIPTDTANKMIQSYLNSVGYPSVDTSIRSLSFDADTMRAYLQNSNIVTIKFMIAHNAATAYGTTNAAGLLDPAQMTMIIVGLDDNENYIYNNQNGVYDHFSPCPVNCVGKINQALLD